MIDYEWKSSPKSRKFDPAEVHFRQQQGPKSVSLPVLWRPLSRGSRKFTPICTYPCLILDRCEIWDWRIDSDPLPIRYMDRFQPYRWYPVKQTPRLLRASSAMYRIEARPYRCSRPDENVLWVLNQHPEFVYNKVRALIGIPVGRDDLVVLAKLYGLDLA